MSFSISSGSNTSASVFVGANADELKKWEIKRVKKLISENIERQKANNITLIFNTNKEEIIIMKY